MNLDKIALVLSVLSMAISIGVVIFNWYKGRRRVEITFSKNDTDGAIEVLSILGDHELKRISLFISILAENKSTNPIAINFMTVSNGTDEIASTLDPEYVTTCRSRIWPPANGCSDYFESHITSSSLPIHIEAFGASIVRFHFYLNINFKPNSVSISTSRGVISADQLALPVSDYIHNRGKYTN